MAQMHIPNLFVLSMHEQNNTFTLFHRYILKTTSKLQVGAICPPNLASSSEQKDILTWVVAKLYFSEGNT